jgi:hypothetical protein
MLVLNIKILCMCSLQNLEIKQQEYELFVNFKTPYAYRVNLIPISHHHSMSPSYVAGGREGLWKRSVAETTE